MLNVQLLIIKRETHVSGPPRRVGARDRISTTLTWSSQCRCPSHDCLHFGACKLPTPHFGPSFYPSVHPRTCIPAGPHFIMLLQKWLNRSRCHLGFQISTQVDPRKPLLGGGAHWRYLVNAVQPFMCSGNAACCQITVTTYFFLSAGPCTPFPPFIPSAFHAFSPSPSRFLIIHLWSVGSCKLPF